MLYADIYLEKIAAKINNSTPPTRAEKDRQLIEQYKKSNSTFEKNLIFNDIKREFREVVSSCISQSGILSTMDFADAQKIAENKLRAIIEKFDLQFDNKPTTFVIGNLKRELQRETYNNRDNTVRRSTDLSMKNGYIKTAEKVLAKQLGRRPADDEIYKYITKEMDLSIDFKDISRNRMYDRTILSGNQTVGGDESGAEHMTLMDMKHVSKQTPEQIGNAQAKQDALDGMLNNNFARPERKMLRNYYGFGEFKGKDVNANRAAINAGMSYYEAKKVIDRFEHLFDQFNKEDEDQE